MNEQNLNHNSNLEVEPEEKNIQELEQTEPEEKEVLKKQEESPLDVEALQKENEALKAERDQLAKERDKLARALDERVKLDLDALEVSDRELIEEMSEGNPLKKMEVYARLLKAGKIMNPSMEQAEQRAKQNLKQQPKTPEEAAKAVLNAAIAGF